MRVMVGSSGGHWKCVEGDLTEKMVASDLHGQANCRCIQALRMADIGLEYDFRGGSTRRERDGRVVVHAAESVCFYRLLAVPFGGPSVVVAVMMVDKHKKVA